MVAHQFDFFDLGHIAFDHTEGQVDTVALNRCDGGGDLRAIQGAVDVLALELLLGTIGQSLVKGATIGQTDVPQSFL